MKTLFASKYPLNLSIFVKCAISNGFFSKGSKKTLIADKIEQQQAILRYVMLLKGQKVTHPE